MRGPDRSRTVTALHRTGLALVGVVLLSGCGTRLEDAAIRRAAGLDVQDAGTAAPSASEMAAGAGPTAEAPSLAASGGAAAAALPAGPERSGASPRPALYSRTPGRAGPPHPEAAPAPLGNGL